MTSRPEIQCVSCIHWRSPLDRDDQQDAQLCAAFATGIPDDIWWGRFDHRQPHEGDHGIRWEPDGDMKFPEWAIGG